MTITVRFFASLSEQLGMKEITVETDSIQTLSDVWARVTDQTPPDSLLCARNHAYVAFDTAVQDGDEVAFFPPVNGG